MKYKKKLIEVALPLEAINVASAREKSIRHGHPSTLHLWWARRPLAAARAVIFAQMVDDPSQHPELFDNDEKQGKERQRLFKIMEELITWEGTTNQSILEQANHEIMKSWRITCSENANNANSKKIFNPLILPGFHDPFAGGGAIPLEAQRLGLESCASDLNPVAVLINKSMIEIPPRFSGNSPVNPIALASQSHSGSWKGAQGLAADLEYYGDWMRQEAQRRIGHLYPEIIISTNDTLNRPDLQGYVDKSLKVIAWLWVRTVKSPNPAFADIDVPLASTFVLCSKTGKESYVEPIINNDSYTFAVKTGTSDDIETLKNGTKLSRGANFRCLMSNVPISGDYIKGEGKAGRMNAKLMAVVVQGDRGRIYLTPTFQMEKLALSEKPNWEPENELVGKCRDQLPLYGMDKFADIFTQRQLIALTTLTDLVAITREKIFTDCIGAGLMNDQKTLDKGGNGATAYADALSVYLAFSIDKAADYWSSICTWHSSKELIRNTFGRQAIQMTWDFAETNIFSESTGNISSGIDWAVKALLAFPASKPGLVFQADAQTQQYSKNRVISTDPPYYDNICYADLSDYFYIWMRRSLKNIYPDLFATLAVPKEEELIAATHRHGTKLKAENFFLKGMTDVMRGLSEQAHPAFPVTIYYAFKQAESNSKDGTTNTGWDTFLAAVITAGFAISGTWPIRTELSNRMISSGTNALASSIVLVCRKKLHDSQNATLREFLTQLKKELPVALSHLQAGNIAPVDLAQAAIGPGMAVYTRYAKVLDAEGEPLSVRAALALINQTLDEALAEQEGDFDADTRWALTWFDQSGFDEGDYGVAEQLSKSKNTAVSGLVDGGILLSKSGKVRLLRPAELAGDWNPESDKRLTVWEIVHQLVRALEASGEGAASILVAKLGSKAETARELCYRLYTLCERRKRAAEAMSYNGLVQSWPEITRLASEKPATATVGTSDLFEQE